MKPSTELLVGFLILIIVILAYKYYTNEGFYSDNVKVNQVIDSTGAVARQPIPSYGDPEKHLQKVTHPEDVMQADQLRSFQTFGIGQQSANNVEDNVGYYTVNGPAPDIDYNTYMMTQNLDQRVMDNQRRWQQEMSPWSAGPMTVDYDLDMEAYLPFQGLQRPQGVPQSNPFFVTEIGPKDTAVNNPFNFIPNATAEAIKNANAGTSQRVVA